MSKSNQLLVPYDAAKLLIVAGRDDLPVVVCVIVGVASDLLALAGNATIIISQRIGVGVTVKVRLGLLVSDSNGIIVLDIDSACQHDIVAQCLLELWRHEVVAGTRSSQNSKMHLEPEKVEHEGQDNQANGAGCKVLSKQLKADGSIGSLDIQKLPQINNDSGANGDESKETNVLGRDVARQCKASQDKPLPPLPAKRLVSQLVELDVEQETAGHGKHQCSVKEDEASLANVRIVQKDQSGSDKTSRYTITRFPHDQIRDRHSQCAKEGGQGSERDIGHLVGNVGVADVFEVEVAVISNKPANEGKEQLGKRGMDIEKVGSLKVVGGKL